MPPDDGAVYLVRLVDVLPDGLADGLPPDATVTAQDARRLGVDIDRCGNGYVTPTGDLNPSHEWVPARLIHAMPT